MKSMCRCGEESPASPILKRFNFELNVVPSLRVRSPAQAMRLMLPMVSFENLCIAAGTQNHACNKHVLWCSRSAFSACVVEFCSAAADGRRLPASSNRCTRFKKVNLILASY